MKSFQQWSEHKDVYGFENQFVNVKPNPLSDIPVIQLDAVNIIRTLAAQKLGEIKGQQNFDDEVRWGSKTGASRIKITPNGNVIFSRLANDLNGNNVWVCKKTYRIDDDDFSSKEDIIISDIMNELHKMASIPVERAIRKKYDLITMARKIAKEAKRSIPGVFMYENIKEVNPTNYIIYFSLRGTGHGVVKYIRRVGFSPYLNIDISYDHETGLLRVIVNTTSITEKGGGWEVGIPTFDEKFLTTQDSEEIIQNIITTIRFF